MSILKHPIWEELKPYFVIENHSKDGKGFRRIEVTIRNNPELAKRALNIRVQCAACGEPHNPIRVRDGVSGNGFGNLYYAASCPLSVSIKCSRGKASTTEYNRVIEALGGVTWPEIERRHSAVV